MRERPLLAVAELLLHHYGTQELPGDPFSWITLVKIVLAHGRATAARSADWSWLEASPLTSPSEAAIADAQDLGAILESHRYPAQRAETLRRLARWIVKRTDRVADDGTVWDSSHAALRKDLAQIPGLSRPLIDRILLFVGGRAVYPMDRASIRIAFRHGWLTEADDPQEAESFFVRGLEQAEIDARQFSLWAGRIGKDFCGPRPQCDACPLRPLLPAGGPYAGNDD